MSRSASHPDPQNSSSSNSSPSNSSSSKNPVSTTEIYLLRHGECEGGRIFRGRSDVALLPEGEQHMWRAAKHLQVNWDAIVSSPLKRCLHFAKRYSEQHHHTLEVAPLLRELDFGEWDGQLIETVWANDHDNIARWIENPASITPPGGEPLHLAMERVQQLFKEIENRHKNKKILLVTHGGIFRLFLGLVLRMPLAALSHLEVPYACVAKMVLYHNNSNSAGTSSTCKLVAHNFGP